jgi:hypothetical protein
MAAAALAGSISFQCHEAALAVLLLPAAIGLATTGIAAYRALRAVRKV